MQIIQFGTASKPAAKQILGVASKHRCMVLSGRPQVGNRHAGGGKLARVPD
jgi:hypothetical protein